MKQLILLAIVSFIILSGYSQNSSVLNLPKDAKVEGNVVEMRTKQPKNNELVIFRVRKIIMNTSQ